MGNPEAVRMLSKNQRVALLAYGLVAALTVLISYWLIVTDSFEQLHSFTRAHESWELDEFISIALAANLGLIGLLVVRSRQLTLQIRTRKKLEAEAKALARHDPLTGLPNRRFFIERVTTLLEERENERGGAVVLIDLDRFKPINDTYGHAAGDCMLRGISDRIAEILPQDGMACRMGGDEFAVILPTENERPALERFTRRLCQKLSEPIDFEGRGLTITASIGIAIFPDDGGTITELLTNADMAMYMAKHNGRNTFAFYEKTLSEKQTRRFRLETELPQAIRDGAFVPHLQPVFELSNGELIAFEILARWEHPELGTVMPAEFISLAEDTDMITELTESVLRQACMAAALWNPPVKLSVNISPVQFCQSGMVSRLARIAEETGFPIELIEVEITEDVFITGAETAAATISELRAHGISVALDDFGKGYSSLGYLSQYDIDRIKIDKSFVINRKSEIKNEKIVDSVIQLGKSLGMQTTAEGIESADDAQWLTDRGCNLGQGFLYSKPLPLLSALSFYLQYRAGTSDDAGAAGRELVRTAKRDRS